MTGAFPGRWRSGARVKNSVLVPDQGTEGMGGGVGGLHYRIAELSAMLEFLQQLRNRASTSFPGFCEGGVSSFVDRDLGGSRCLWSFSPGAGSSADPLWGRTMAHEPGASPCCQPSLQPVGDKLGKRFMNPARVQRALGVMGWTGRASQH